MVTSQGCEQGENQYLGAAHDTFIWFIYYFMLNRLLSKGAVGSQPSYGTKHHEND